MTPGVNEVKIFRVRVTIKKNIPKGLFFLALLSGSDMKIFFSN